eukprot:Opistho-1_new@76566
MSAAQAAEGSRLLARGNAEVDMGSVDAPWALRRRSKLFKDASNLFDEMSFVYYYHSHAVNQALHLTTTLSIFLGIFCLLALPDPLRPGGVPVLSVAFACIYVAYYLTLHVPVALSFAAVFAGLLYVASYAGPRLEAYPDGLYIAGATVVCASLQGVGHVIFERRLPAFRLFEFAVTTPFTLMLLFLMACGYAPRLRDAVRVRSEKWVGTERRKF